MSTTTDCIKKMLIVSPPSFILGGLAYFFMMLTQGSEGLRSVSGLWYFAFFLGFDYLLAVKHNAKHTFAYSLKYLSYFAWLLPVFMFIYFTVTGSQVSNDKALGATIGFIGALIFSTGIGMVSGLVGLVFHMIQKNIFESAAKNRKRKLKEKHAREKEQLAINEGNKDAIKTTGTE